MERNDFLRVMIGGTAVLIPAASLLSCSGRGPEGFEAWDGPPPDADPRLRLLGWAILAPSALNKQPWWVDLGNDGVLVHADRRRRAPATDPDGRETLQSVGAFVEFLTLAAGAEGFQTAVRMFPGGLPPTLDDLDEYPVAHVDLQRSPSTAPDPLFGGVRRRRTNRYEFSGPPLTPDEESALAAAMEGSAARLRLLTDPGTVMSLAGLTADSVAHETGSFTMYAESAGMLRFTHEELATQRDGMDLGNYGLRGLDLVLTRVFQSRNDLFEERFRERSVDLARRAAFSAQAYGIITTPGNSREEQVIAGRAFARVHLGATLLNLALQPFGQASRFDETRSRLAGLAGTGSETVQLLFRLGRAPESPQSVRRRLEDIVGVHEP